MQVRVDADKCQGHNRCYALAPELFDVDDYGQSHVRIEGDVPPELEEKARLAVANCPEYAISIEEASEASSGPGVRSPASVANGEASRTAMGSGRAALEGEE